jgi:hypothetical protein
LRFFSFWGSCLFFLFTFSLFCFGGLGLGGLFLFSFAVGRVVLDFDFGFDLDGIFDFVFEDNGFFGEEEVKGSGVFDAEDLTSGQWIPTIFKKIRT